MEHIKQQIQYEQGRIYLLLRSGLNGCVRCGRKLIAIMVALLVMMLSIPTYAAVFSQPPLDGGVSNSFVTTDPEGSDADTWVYDEFRVAKSATINTITWHGQANPNAAGFTIQILSAQPVTPDTIVSDQVVATINVPDNASQTPGANGLYTFHVDLQAPLNLTAGTHYWITIYSNGTAPWGWGNGSGGNNKSISFNRGQAMWLPAPGDRAFSSN